MAKKRGNGEGSIKQRANGTWEGKYTIGRDENGKLIVKSLYGKTRREVAEKLNQKINLLNNNAYINESNMLLEKWIMIWLNDYKKLNVKATTYVNYRSRIKNHIIPYIGKISLKKLTTHNVQQMVNSLVSKNISATLIKDCFKVLNGCLEQAIKNEMIYKNVAKNVSLPKLINKKAEILTPKQQKLFISECKNTYLGNIFIFALGTGLRIGEILALTWSDIDLESGYIKVSKTLNIVYDEKKSKWVKTFGTPKTQSSYRKVPIMPSIKKLSLEQKEYQVKLKEKASELYDYKTNLVFTTRIGTTLDPRNMQRSFHTIANKCNLKDVSIHSLRHTFASRGLEKGVELKVMQEILGHSSIKITADLYTHVLPDTKAKEIIKLEDTIQY